MRISWVKLVGMLVALLLLFIPKICLGMNIIHNFGNLADSQRVSLSNYITAWEGHICCDNTLTIDFFNADLGGPSLELPNMKAGVELFIGTSEKGEFITLAETDQFQPDGNGEPTHARIRFNNNLGIPWQCDFNQPLDPNKYDFFSVAHHELCHACGFTVNYNNFSSHVTSGPASFRTFTCDGFTVNLEPDTFGTHVCADSIFSCIPGDLMNRLIDKGVRRRPEQWHFFALNCAFSCSKGNSVCDAPTLTEWGLVILVVLIVVSAWVVMRKRKAVRIRA